MTSGHEPPSLAAGLDVVRLASEDIGEAKALVDRVFPRQGPRERLSFWAYARRERWFVRAVFRLTGVQDMHAVWVVRRAGTGAIVGTTGLYSLRRDCHEAVWLSWFCIAPEARGSGAGSRLLDFSIDRARATGRRFLRLYTSDDPNERAAQGLYDKKGLRVVSQWRSLSGTTTVREVRLA